MGKIEIILVAILTMIENISFSYVILKMQRQKAISKKGVELAGVVLIYFVLLMCGYEYPVMHLALGAVTIFLFRYMYDISLRESVKIWIFLFSLLAFVEGVCSLVIRTVVPQISNFTDLLFTTLATIFLLWIYHCFIGREMDQEKFQIPTRLWIMAEGLLLFYSLMVVYFINLLESIRVSRLVIVGTVLVLLGGVGAFGMALAMIYYFNGAAMYKVQSEMAEMYNEQQKDYFLNLLERETETKKFRHDIINHLMVIQSLCQKEDTQIKDYISKLLDDREGISYKQYDVGNDIVNVIINYYFTPIQENCDITVKGCVGGLETISGVDLCVIVSNLLKNAVEAASRMQEGKGKICFFISEGNQYLNIRVENSYEGDIIFGKEGMPKTSKAEKGSHGFGIWNVKEAAEKYQGKLKIEAENNWYIADVFMKLS